MRSTPRHRPERAPAALGLTLAAVCCIAGDGSAACDAAVPDGVPGQRLTIIERYGDPPTRSVRLEATLVAESATITGLTDVSVIVEPHATGGQKLAAILHDARLARDTPTGWPTEAHPLPAEATPLLRRVQLALWVLDGTAGPGAHQRADVDIFDDITSLGLTQVTRDGDHVRLRSLAVAAVEGDTAIGLGDASGEARADHAALRGFRHLAGQAPEAVEFRFERGDSAPPASH